MNPARVIYLAGLALSVADRLLIIYRNYQILRENEPMDPNSFKDLTPEEEEEYREWARKNYRPFTDIPKEWHPAIQAECVYINVKAHQAFHNKGE